MPVKYAIRTSFRKYRRAIWRTTFGILPTVILLIILVLFSGASKSVDVFIQDKVLAQIESRDEIIQIAKSNYGGERITDVLSTRPYTMAYSKEELEGIRQVDHVNTVSPLKPLLGVSGKTSTLVQGKELSIEGIQLVGDNVLDAYDARQRNYEPGRPIPIVISRNVLNYKYIDMKGEDKIRATAEELSYPESRVDKIPVKNKFLQDEFDKETLLGTIFTARMGGLPPIPEVSQSIVDDEKGQSTVWHVRSTEAVSQDRQEQMDLVSPYWDYERLRTGLNIQFEIVGINPDPNGGPSFIPIDAGIALHQQLYDLQLSARTARELPDSSYGLIFDGLRLASDGTLAKNDWLGQAHPYTGLVDIPEERSIFGASQAGLFIPGFIYSASIINGQTVPHEVVDWQATLNAYSTHEAFLLLDDASNRLTVKGLLVDAGYPEAQFGGSYIDQIRSFHSVLNKGFDIFIGILAVLIVIILTTLVWRYVASSQREIGVYRSLGAKRRDVGLLYVVYTTMQVVIGSLIGILVGMIAIRPLADLMITAVYTAGIIPSSQRAIEIGGISFSLDKSDMYHVDTNTIVLFVIGLIFVAFVASLIPAWRASRISPVEAIRNAD